MNYKFFKLTCVGLLFLLMTFSSCTEDEERPVLQLDLPDFNKINVAQNIIVNIHAGEQKVELTGLGLLDSVEMTVVDEELSIYNPNPTLVNDVVADIWVPELIQIICRENSITYFPDNFSSRSNELTLFGRNSAKVKVEQNFTYDSVYFGLRDAATLEIANIQSREVYAFLRNSTRSNIQGFSERFNLVMNDDSQFNIDFPDATILFIEPIASEQVTITTRNDAYAWVYSTNILDANVNDGSIVYYKGKPAIIKQDLSEDGQLLEKDQ
ncbi:hypothetical protein OKW21_003359 [Catalinimonas alkaloidigena]|uniref:GIN domain-containing protein n=1 Tax=Catalinimonas alkaloidigena TaxID=1075417 RepID=UPI002407655D|nr:DUF2807 domain-containing protein [Catalinimonas alkaloidigena]MDF9798096.1 hypothetical protein [Catalinimonas alkaloidigena]